MLDRFAEIKKVMVARGYELDEKCGMFRKEDSFVTVEACKCVLDKFGERALWEIN